MRRRSDVGVLAPGAVADIALLDFSADAFSPLNDVPRQFVYSETGSSVRHTIVAGEIVVEEGRATTMDEAALRAELRALQPMLDQQNEILKASAACARAILP